MDLRKKENSGVWDSVYEILKEQYPVGHIVVSKEGEVLFDCNCLITVEDMEEIIKHAIVIKRWEDYRHELSS